VALLIDNLIGNALKYSPEKGRISVSIKPMAHGAQLIITDEGPGIPVDMRRKVFERFFRVPGQEQTGSGLGLAIAERAALHNHASIHLDAGPGGKGLAAIVEFLSA
jgi:two-component system sensor histidine kinase QseC